MSVHNSHIDYDLAAKYLAGECTPEENSSFEQWLDLSDENKLVFNQLKSIWEISSEPEIEVDVDAAWKKIAPIESDNVIPISGRTSRNNWGWSIAAAVAVLIGVFTALGILNNEMQSLKSGGEMASITLVDGTVVTLQPESELNYPESFGETREITLSGIGYFDVAADKEHPFIIHTDGGDVRVVGTAFEVNTRDEESKLIVEVAEGLVEVSADKGAVKEHVGAGQKCAISQDYEIVVEDLDEPAPFFWKDKTIKFRRTELAQVAQTLQDLLHIQVIVEGEAIQGCELTATFTDETPDKILEVIALTLGLEIKTEGNTYTLSGTGC
ncbi:MAG: FecR domain-containing protein [Flavobacteriales bacterium]